jgi:hypothetical protein
VGSFFTFYTIGGLTTHLHTWLVARISIQRVVVHVVLLLVRAGVRNNADRRRISVCTDTHTTLLLLLLSLTHTHTRCRIVVGAAEEAGVADVEAVAATGAAGGITRRRRSMIHL